MNSNPSPKPKFYSARRIVRLVIASIFAVLSLGFAVTAGLLVVGLLSGSQAPWANGEGILYSIGISFVLACCAWQIFRKRFFWPLPSNLVQTKSYHRWIMEDFRREVRENNGDHGVARAILFLNGSLYKTCQCEDLKAAEALLDAEIAKEPGHLILSYAKAKLLTESNRLADAENLLQSVLCRTDLGPAGRLVFLAGLLRVLVLQSQYDVVRTRCETFLNGSASTDEKLLLLDTLASIPILDERLDYLAEADCWSTIALNLKPDSWTLKATRGALWAEQGNLKAASLLLNEVIQCSGASGEQIIAAFYLALIAKRLGDQGKAREWMMRVQFYRPAGWLSRRIAKEFPNLD